MIKHKPYMLINNTYYETAMEIMGYQKDMFGEWVKEYGDGTRFKSKISRAHRSYVGRSSLGITKTKDD